MTEEPVADPSDVPTSDDAPVDEAAHEAARLRGPRRLVLFGAPGAVVLSMLSGAVGADGRAGLVLLLLLLGAVFGLAGVWAGVGLVLDDVRGRPTGRRRGWVVAGLFLATLVCMTAVTGVLGTEGATT